MNDRDLKKKLAQLRESALRKLREMKEFCEAKIVANPVASIVLLFVLGVITGAAFKP